MKNSLILFILLLLSACGAVKIEDKFYEKEKVKVKIYSTGEDKPTSILIVLPPTGGSTYIDHSYSKKLAKEGFYVARVMSWPVEETKVKDLDVHKRHFLKAHRVVEDIIDQETNFESYSLMGTSLGGIYGLVSLGKINKIDKAVIITAAAPGHEIVARSKSESLDKLRANRFKVYSYKSLKEYEEALRKTSIPNALDYKKALRKKSILLIKSLNDESVPTKNQIALEEAIKPKKVIEYSENHFWTIVKSWIFNSNDVIKFLKENRVNTLDH